MRPQVKLIEGRHVPPRHFRDRRRGAIAKGFANVEVGHALHFADDWTVWHHGRRPQRVRFGSVVDAHQAMQAFRRPAYSTILFRLSHSDVLDAARQAVDADPRLQLDVKRETQFYAEQSESMSSFIKLLGMSLSVIFSIGAIKAP